MIKPGLTWFNAHLKRKNHSLRAKPVYLYVIGANEWRDYDTYPPSSTEQRLYLASDRKLIEDPIDSSPERCCYDPANSTPIIGGTQFSLGGGARSNRRLEQRPDVLSYTSDPIQQSFEVIGAVRLALYVTSSLENTDFLGAYATFIRTNALSTFTTDYSASKLAKETSNPMALYGLKLICGQQPINFAKGIAFVC
jgi:uncharacterized protein